MLKRLSIVTLVAVLALALMGPGLAAAKEKPHDVGKPAPDFEIRNFDTGGMFKLSESMKDKKATAFTYFSSSCNSCRAEISALNAAVKGGEIDLDKVNFYLISVDFTDANIAGYKSGQGLEAFTFLYDPQFKSAKAYGVRATPAMIVINKDGIISYRQLGFAPDELETIVKEIEKAQ